MSSETHAEGHIHHPNYVKIWAILVLLLIISLIGSRSDIRWVLLVTAFGIAIAKAYLVARNFMHVTIEKRWVGYLLVTCLVFIAILFSAVAPDVMRHQGLHWDNTAAKQAIAAGAQGASKHHE